MSLNQTKIICCLTPANNAAKMEACNNRRGRPPQSIFWRSSKTQVLELSQPLKEFDWIDRHQKAQTKICLILAKLKSFQCLFVFCDWGIFQQWSRRMKKENGRSLCSEKPKIPENQAREQDISAISQDLKIFPVFRQGIEGLMSRCQKGESGVAVNIFSFLSFGVVERVRETLFNQNFEDLAPGWQSSGGAADSSA